MGGFTYEQQRALDLFFYNEKTFQYNYIYLVEYRGKFKGDLKPLNTINLRHVETYIQSKKPKKKLDIR